MCIYVYERHQLDILHWTSKVAEQSGRSNQPLFSWEMLSSTFRRSRRTFVQFPLDWGVHCWPPMLHCPFTFWRRCPGCYSWLDGTTHWFGKKQGRTMKQTAPGEVWLDLNTQRSGVAPVMPLPSSGPLKKLCQFGCVRILFNAVARVLFTALQLGVSSPTQSRAIKIFDENSSTKDASAMSKHRTTRMIQNGQCWVSTSDSEGLSGSEDLQSWRQNGDESTMHNYLHGNCTAFSGLRKLGLRGHFT